MLSERLCSVLFVSQLTEGSVYVQVFFFLYTFAILCFYAKIACLIKVIKTELTLRTF